MGKALAHISLLPYLALFHQASVVYSRREISGVLFLLGSVLNIGSGKFLKKALNQVRPLSTCEALGICNKPGMPSSHSQVTFFLLTLEVFQLVRKTHKFHWDRWQRLAQHGMVLCYTAASVLVAYSRVYLGYHDLPQVLAGAAAGTAVAAVCFTLTSCAAKHFPAWQQSTIGRSLKLKDTWAIDDTLLFEYNNTLSNKSRKLM